MVLQSSGLPAGAFPLGATQGLRVCSCFPALEPFLCAWGDPSRVHAVMVSCLHAAVLRSGHQQKDNKQTTGGQEQVKSQELRKRRTRGGQEGAGDGLRATGGQEEGNKKTTGGHRAHRCRQSWTPAEEDNGTARRRQEDEQRESRGQQKDKVWRQAGSRGEAGVNKRATAGLLEDKKKTSRRRQAKRRTTGGQEEDKGRTTGRQEEDKRRKRE